MDGNGNGALFGKYELGRLLGCGAFAKVYHARNVVNGQSVAVKVVSKSKIAGTVNLMNNVKREISIMRRLRHRHIVKLFEVLATKSKIYFVMELVKGGELFAKVAKGRLSEDLSRKCFQQLISAVGYCHLRGVYHRDLKPENILLDESGNIKVSDFGLSAIVVDQTHHDSMLQTLCGTPAYVAPEVLIKKGYDGAKVDIWSCGVILFVLTAGFLPFNDPNLMTMYRKIYKGDFRCPKWMSLDLKRFLHRLLDTNPETRITIDEIIKHPWFKIDCKEINLYEEESVAKDKKEDGFSLNAFDIISFSSGLNLSGLFDESSSSSGYSERFVSAESPEVIIKKVEEVVEGEGGMKLKKTDDWCVELKGRNGNLILELEVNRLTNSLVVIEVKGDNSDSMVWKEKIRPLLVSLQVNGN